MFNFKDLLTRDLFAKSRAHDLLAKGQIHRGLMSAVKKRQWELILFYVDFRLKLPEGETRQRTAVADPNGGGRAELRSFLLGPPTQLSGPRAELRGLLFGLTAQLINLSKSASDARNPVPNIFKKSISTEVYAAFDALFQFCERLQIVAEGGVDPVRLQTELEQEAANLRQLLEATEEASAEMARLTLSAGRGKVADASDKFARLGWAARELTQFSRELE